MRKRLTQLTASASASASLLPNLKRDVVDELGLLDDSEDGVSADEGLETLAPVQEVVIVEHAAAEVRRREGGGMLGMEVICRRTDEPIAQRRFTDAFGP